MGSPIGIEGRQSYHLVIAQIFLDHAHHQLDQHNRRLHHHACRLQDQNCHSRQRPANRQPLYDTSRLRLAFAHLDRDLRGHLGLVIVAPTDVKHAVRPVNSGDGQQYLLLPDCKAARPEVGDSGRMELLRRWQVHNRTPMTGRRQPSNYCVD